MPDQKATGSEPESDCSVSPWYRSAWKRLLDICAAVFLLIVVLPVMTVVAIGVKCTSRGPILFRQHRPGKNGSEFSIFKFRTMVHSAQSSGPVLTRSADPRITWFGQYLRRWKLDELPQLFNVVAGDMSFVGPRPQPTKLWQQPSIQKQAACVLSVRPGLTSQATLNFRNEEELLGMLGLSPQETESVYMQHIMPLKLGMDLEYLRRATFLDDLNLLLRTTFRIFRREVPTDNSLIKECLPPALQARGRAGDPKKEYAAATEQGD